MTTQAPPVSQDLTAARELLDRLDAQKADTDSQTKAITAAAHCILVLAEQVAAIRVLIVGDAMSRSANGQPAQQTQPASQSQPAQQTQPAPQRQPAQQSQSAPQSQPKPQRQPAPQNKKKRGWW